MIEKEKLFCAIGDEPIQMIEASEYINNLFNESTGFERCVSELVNNDTWADFKHSVSSPSLFCQKRLFEINDPDLYKPVTLELNPELNDKPS